MSDSTENGNAPLGAGRHSRSTTVVRTPHRTGDQLLAELKSFASVRDSLELLQLAHLELSGLVPTESEIPFLGATHQVISHYCLMLNVMLESEQSPSEAHCKCRGRCS